MHQPSIKSSLKRAFGRDIGTQIRVRKVQLKHGSLKLATMDSSYYLYSLQSFVSHITRHLKTVILLRTFLPGSIRLV